MSEPPHRPAGHLKNMAMTAAGTLGSRVFGLAREVTVAAFFGTSPVANAFILAFLIPNLFRRLLGEGALTTALVPVMAHERRRGGEAQAFAFLNVVLRRIAPWLVGIAVGLAALAWYVSGHWEQIAEASGFAEQLQSTGSDYPLAAKLAAMCMPYMPLICLAALFTAGLNLMGRFGLTSLSAMWQNITMIIALAGFGAAYGDTPQAKAMWLCGGVLTGGLIQLVLPVWGLWREGWRPGLVTPAPSAHAWKELSHIFIPALLGAGAQQINVALTRVLAFGLDSRALSVYYYPNQLVELPVGLFSVTVSTVVFPLLAAHAAHDDRKGFADTYAHGLRLIFAINIAAAAGLIALAEPLVRVCFERGAFTAEDTALTVPVLVILAFSMPLYGVIGISSRALSALKDARYQSRLAWRALLLNALLVPVAGWFFKAPGLAAANLVAAIFQCVLLVREVRRRDPHLSAASVFGPLRQVLFSAVLMAVVVAIGRWLIHHVGLSSKLAAYLSIGLLIPAGAVIYFAMLRAMRYPEADELLGYVAKFRRKLGL